MKLRALEGLTWALPVWTLLLLSFGSMVCGIENYDTEEYSSKYECVLRLKRSSPKVDPFLSGSNPNYLDGGYTDDCIRYQDVNEALRQAIKVYGYVPRYKNADLIERNELDRIANVILETTRNLAMKFQLSPDEVYHGLPTIDTSKTDIWDICPDSYKPRPCAMSRFRTFDGQCSDLRNSVMGMARTAYKRFLLPAYSDGISEARVSPVDGSPLPHVRAISIKAHSDIGDLTTQRSILLPSWAQFIGHDITLADFPRTSDGTEIQCCPPFVNATNPPNPNCRPIPIAKNDPYYWRYNSTCMQFIRNLAGIRPECALGPRIPTNFVTARLDVNFLYGNSLRESQTLRSFSKGMLLTVNKYEKLGLKDLLPPQVERAEENCLARPRKKFCFLTGDTRANFQPQVAALHHVYVREHNRISAELSYLNPHWDDERLFQETRHIMIAMVQHITFNEFLPLVVGPEYMQIYNLTLQKEGYWYGYDKNTPLGTDITLQSAAFRFGHTLLHNKFDLYNKYHKFVDTWELHFVIAQPFNLYIPGNIDRVLGGMVDSPLETFDRYMTSEVTKHLFQLPNQSFGRDLASTNINRGRDNALPGYNEFREFCGLPRAKTFEDLDYYLGNSSAYLLSNIYKHPDEIDLWTGGIAERVVEGGFVGPTFGCLIARQFGRNRRADRFWYENSGFPSSFTPGQLQEIRKTTQARMICENADDYPTIQQWVLLMADPVNNPRYNCKDLPQMNLEYWIEDPKTKQFKYLN